MSGRTKVATLLLSLACYGFLGCGWLEPPPDVGCEGEEVEFSSVGMLAGNWQTDDCGCRLEFDNTDRIRVEQLGQRVDEFGCEPGQYPLVLDGVTIQHNPPDPTEIFELVDITIEGNSIRMVHQDGGEGGGFVIRGYQLVDSGTLMWDQAFSSTQDVELDNWMEFYRVD